jgi:site-specific DNA recombinase
LVDRVLLTPEDDTLRIDLEGDIAHILALASNSKKPAALGDGFDDLAEQFKLVAGVGFEPTTFRL